MVPTVEFPPVMLSTSQVTAVLLSPVTTAANCAVPEGKAQGADGVTATAAGGVPEIPVPCNGTTMGPPAALSAMVRFAMRLPSACGSNSTCTLQLAPTVRIPPPWPFPQFVVKG